MQGQIKPAQADTTYIPLIVYNQQKKVAKYSGILFLCGGVATTIPRQHRNQPLLVLDCCSQVLNGYLVGVILLHRHAKMLVAAVLTVCWDIAKYYR